MQRLMDVAQRVQQPAEGDGLFLGLAVEELFAIEGNRLQHVLDFFLVG